MSVKVKKNKIEMTRGDTLYLTVSLTDRDGSEYIPAEGDAIRFALKDTALNRAGTDYADEEPLIVKDVDMETMQLKLDPADTKPLGFGTYVYDMQITKANGDVDTFIPPTSFVLTPEVD